MSQIKTIDSEAELKYKIYHYLHKDRSFKQMAFYFDEGADLFCKLGSRMGHSFVVTPEEQYEFIKKHCLDKTKKTAFISLGCGDGRREKEILRSMKNEGYSFTYVGIDSSMPMLELAQKNLDEIDCDQEYICADFASSNFKSYINHYIENFDLKIYAFIGGTIGGVEQAYIMDSLKELVSAGDFLWIDCQVRIAISPLEDKKLFDRYLEYSHDPDTINFIMSPLTKLGVTKDQGSMYFEMIDETPVNCIRFKFGFKFKEKVLAEFRGEKMIFSMGEMIELINIRVYDRDSLVDFVEDRDFILIDELIKETKGHFLFKKEGRFIH